MENKNLSQSSRTGTLGVPTEFKFRQIVHASQAFDHITSLGPLPAEVFASAIEEHTARLAEIERKVISMPA